MKKYKNIIILINLVLVLVLFNSSVVKKEKILSEGTLILLELAPVDPRSLMQGDYMALRYQIATGIDTDSITKRGYCVVQLDEKGIGKRVRLQEEQTPLHAGEYLIPYTTSAWRINIGAESFFFQEGEAEKYEDAEYGGLKVDDEGNSILIGLYDEHLKLLQ